MSHKPVLLQLANQRTEGGDRQTRGGREAPAHGAGRALPGGGHRAVACHLAVRPVKFYGDCKVAICNYLGWGLELSCFLKSQLPNHVNNSSVAMSADADTAERCEPRWVRIAHLAI